MSKPEQVEPKWVLVAGSLREVGELGHLAPGQRPEAVCPLCERQVTLKLGQQVRHHYEHLPDATCAATHWQTVLHLNTKFHFYKQLAARATAARLLLKRLCLGTLSGDVAT